MAPPRRAGTGTAARGQAARWRAGRRLKPHSRAAEETWDARLGSTTAQEDDVLL
jgi:hypothetical protein